MLYELKVKIIERDMKTFCISSKLSAHLQPRV